MNYEQDLENRIEMLEEEKLQLENDNTMLETENRILLEDNKKKRDFIKEFADTYEEDKAKTPDKKSKFTLAEFLVVVGVGVVSLLLIPVVSIFTIYEPDKEDTNTTVVTETNTPLSNIYLKDGSVIEGIGEEVEFGMGGICIYLNNEKTEWDYIPYTNIEVIKTRNTQTEGE